MNFKRFVITAFLLCSVGLAHDAWAKDFLPYKKQEILDQYTAQAKKLKVKALVRESDHKYEVGKENFLYFGELSADGRPLVVSIKGVPTHDFKFFPNTVEGTFILYDLLTKKFSTDEKKKLAKELNIKRQGNVGKAYGESIVRGMLFELEISGVSGIFFRVKTATQE